jgi:MFS family permease
MSAGEVGKYYSAVAAPATLISILAGGALNDWLVPTNKRASFWILAGCFGVTVPTTWAFLLVHNFVFAMTMSLVITVVGGLWVAPSYALVQSLAGPNLRAIAAAIFMLLVNVVGLGLGPYLTGAISDRLTGRFGNEALTVSLCLVTLTCAAGVVNFVLATRTVTADIAEAEGTA